MGAAAAGPTTISTTTGLTTITPGQQAEAHVADNLNRFSERVLSRYMNMVPQITLRPGTRLRVYFTEDTIMSFYGGRQ
jgi:type IV secretory pathway VirB10-like protein